MGEMAPRTTQGATNRQLIRYGWAPIPVLLAAILVFRASGAGGVYEAEKLRLGLSFVFYTLVSLSTIFLMARSFLAGGSPGLLWMECGVVLWSLAGTVGDAADRGDANINVTIFNTVILLSGLCHLVGAVQALRSRVRLRARWLWLAGTVLLALGTVGLVTYAARAQWLPVFFIPGQGGTTVRTYVLISAIAMFVLAAGLLHSGQEAPRSKFTRWYVLAMLLLAVGLFGIMVQLSLWTVVNWLARTAQWLGGLYLLIAAVAWMLESEVPALTLLPAPRAGSRYASGVAIAAVLAATAVRLAFLQPLGTRSTFITFYPAVMLAALYGGLRAGVLTTILSAGVAAYFWMEPTGQLAIASPADCLALGIFLASGSLISWITEGMLRAREHSAAAEAEARAAAERAQVAEALRASHERMKRVLEVETVGVMFWDLNTGRMTDANDAFLKLMGYSRQEVEGGELTWQNLTPPEYFEISQAEVRKFMATGRVGPYEKEYFRKDGTRQWMVFAGSSLGNNSCVEFCVDISARKEAEDRLKSNLAALTRIHELSEMGLGEVGLDSMLQEAMDAAVAIMGAEHGTLQLLEGETLRIVAHHGHQQAFLDFFASAETRASVCGEATKRGERVVVPDVEESPLFSGTESLAVLRAAGVRAVQSTPLMSRSGKLLGILTTQWAKPFRPDEHDLWRVDLLARQASDLIEQTRAHRAVREKEERLRLATSAAKLGVFEWNVQADTAIWENDRMYEIFGLQPGSEAVNRKRFLHEVLLPEDLPRFERDLSESMRCGGLFRGSYRIRHCGDGELRWIEYFSRFETGPDGKVIRLVGVLEDITERKQAEDALRASEERFRVVQELSPDGFSILRPVRNEQGRVVDFTWVYENATTARVTGTDPNTLAGQSLLDMFPSHRGTEILRAYQEVAETRERQVLEARYGAETVAPTWFRLAVVPLGNDIAVLAQDITRQREFQAELQRLVDERTERLQELVGELEHFSYTITHDMRAPLRAMRGFSDLISLTCEDCERKEPKELLRKITTSGERMDRLITDALNYNRSVRQELPLEDVHTGALLRGMLDTYPEFQATKARIEMEGKLPVVLGNEAGLTQVFSNLLGNAVKFVKDGEVPQIRIWAESVPLQRTPVTQQSSAPPLQHSNQLVRIWVEDKGIGISKEMLPRVFDMFSRGSKSHEGTGIGLALVRKVMQRMGGRVGVESEEGKGSRFWLELRAGERLDF